CCAGTWPRTNRRELSKVAAIVLVCVLDVDAIGPPARRPESAGGPDDLVAGAVITPLRRWSMPRPREAGSGRSE
ncbi:MAG: hypothetical protein ACLQVF_07990, partial [Isosphaeraceae bacterium]